MRISDWSSDVCSSDLHASRFLRPEAVEVQLAATLFLEGDVDPAPVAQRLAVDRLPIFLAGKVDAHRLGIVANVGDTRIRPRFAPPGIKFSQIGRASGRERVCQ